MIEEIFNNFADIFGDMKACEQDLISDISVAVQEENYIKANNLKMKLNEIQSEINRQSIK